VSDAPNTPPSDMNPAPAPASALTMPVLISLLPLASLATLYFLYPVIAPALMAHVGRPVEDYGWLGGALGAGSVLFFCVSHAITPVLGPVGALRLGLLICIFGGLLLMSGQWPLMLLGCAMTGFGYGTTTPAGSQILADFTPKASWGTLFSIRQSGVPAGGVLAGIIAGATLQHSGWVISLWAAIVPVALTAAFLLVTPRRYNHARQLEVFATRRLFDWHNIIRPFQFVRELKGMALLVAAGAGLAMGHGAVTQFLVIYLNAGLGISIAQAALLFAIMQTSAIAGRIVVGALVDRFGTPIQALRLLAPLSAVSCLALAAFNPTWSLTEQICAAVIMGMTVGTWNGLYLAEIARRAPPAQISTATASSAVFTFLSYMITPPLVGVLAATIGWRETFVLIALAPMFAGILLFYSANLTDGTE
jgi:MFS family permease